MTWENLILFCGPPCILMRICRLIKFMYLCRFMKKWNVIYRTQSIDNLPRSFLRYIYINIWVWCMPYIYVYTIFQSLQSSIHWPTVIISECLENKYFCFPWPLLWRDLAHCKTVYGFNCIEVNASINRFTKKIRNYFLCWPKNVPFSA